MISAFSVMSRAAGQPFAVTGGVGEALIAAASASAMDLQKKVPITITSDGTLYVEDRKTTIDGMARYMQAEQAKGEDVTVIIRADTHAQYGLFVTVLDTLKKLNIDKIAVATDVQ